MKKLSLLIILCLFATSAVLAQGKLIETQDPAVARMEGNRKTAAPFSVLFKNEASYKEQEAQSLFSTYLSLRTGTDELRLKTRDVSDGISFTRFHQYFKGIKVEHGTYGVSAKNEKVSFITGDFYTVPDNTNTQPAITEAAALSKALSFTNATVYKWQIPDEEAYLKKEEGDPLATYYPKGELVFTEDFMNSGELTGKVRLAYKFNVYAEKPLSRAYIYVDAVTGKILLSDLIIKHLNSGRKNHGVTSVKSAAASKPVSNMGTTAANSPLATGTAATRYSGTVSLPTRLVSGSYQLLASFAGEGYPIQTVNNKKGTNYNTAANFIDANNAWTAAEFDNANFDNIALDAHWGAMKVYDYWKVRHNRASYNNGPGGGAVIKSHVHHDLNYDNAFWNGSVMTYGDGSQVNGGFLPLTSLDVCSHEVGHAVCTNTSNLAYNRESGAMNEGFSDIWGAAVEKFADPLETDIVKKNYFDIGEEIGLPLPTPLRSMSSPKLYAQPDTYGGTYWKDVTVAGCPTPSNANDNCGVHYNSGVLNKWFYLLVTGGSGTNDIGSAYGVPAIGWVDAEKIAFATELALTSTATYAAARTASINAATTQFPGTCPVSIQVEAVTRAWYAVGVGADFIPCSPQINFAGNTTLVTETAGTNCATGIKTLNIPLKISQAASGGTADPTATVTVTGGTATAGIDYVYGSGIVTFPRGNAANQNLVITIKDDGNIEPNDSLIITLQNVTANGSNASKANVGLVHTVIITNDDKPEDAGGLEPHTIGVTSLAMNNTSPFHSISASTRTQYIMSVADLQAAGVRRNVPITNMSAFVTTKASTQPYNGYTISMGNTAATNVATAWVTGLTTFYTGNYTTVAGTNNFPLTPAGFQWDGTSNVAIQVCFSNATAGTANDNVNGYTGTLTNSTNWVGSAVTTGGCALAFAVANSSFTPVYTFTQNVPPSAIETTLSNTRQWPVDDLAVASTNMFYSTATGGLIAKVKNNSAALGCVTATVTGAGTTFPALGAAFPGRNRSAKEVTITPTTNGATSTYNATIYLTTSELAGKAPGTLQLVKTNAATDAGITASNTVVVAAPTLTTGTNYTGFSGDFTGFSRFFMIDGPLSFGPIQYIFTGNGNWDVAANWSGNNRPPAILPAGEQIIIDHTVGGVCNLNITQTISAGATLTVNSGKNLLVPGTLIRN